MEKNNPLYKNQGIHLISTIFIEVLSGVSKTVSALFSFKPKVILSVIAAGNI